MMHLRGLALFLLCLAGGARRSIRINDSHQNAQQQNIMLADGLEVSAEAQEALIPGTFKTGGLRRAKDTLMLMATGRRARSFVEKEIKDGRKACLFVAPRSRDPRMAAGLYYSTTTGNTETVAGYIAEATGLEAMDIGDASGDDIAACDSLIIGAPTWHTGATRSVAAPLGTSSCTVTS